jgi:hypothetical protein
VLLVARSIAFYALKATFEALAKLLEAYKNSGLPIPLRHRDRTEVRRRGQFCTVVGADLAYLAKAESWNDQYFTDLEAEVEIEGHYYSSALKRLLRRRSSGLRRVPSLASGRTG